MNPLTNITTLGELKTQGYQSKSIKQELRDNLITALQNGQTVFEGVWGYEQSVIPQLERAILAQHNINLLGLRGQAKTRLARLMVELLDEWIPIVKGSEINDDPLNPLSRFAKDCIKEHGDKTPIQWLHRSERFFEKLATPDVTVADLIGDVDPIKAANLRLSYADDRVIHFGMIPRANRCIYVLNELPDLQARIQVSLFNILQEGDIQIRGFKVRMPVDVQFVFTANPEDYTNRGSIVTPLKDRIGSQILTHYPQTVEIAQRITQQEVQLSKQQRELVYVPQLAKELLEQISFEARQSPYIDYKSGVSARMSITAYENLISTAERRALLQKDSKVTLRLSDFLGAVPAITGKVELVYEGEQEGADVVAQQLINAAVKTLFGQLFPKISKLQKPGTEDPYAKTIQWFFETSSFSLPNGLSEGAYHKLLDSVNPLQLLLEKYQPDLPAEDSSFVKELILWALVEYERLNKESVSDGIEFRDLIGSYLNDLS